LIGASGAGTAAGASTTGTAGTAPTGGMPTAGTGGSTIPTGSTTGAIATGTAGATVTGTTVTGTTPTGTTVTGTTPTGTTVTGTAGATGTGGIGGGGGPSMGGFVSGGAMSGGPTSGGSLPGGSPSGGAEVGGAGVGGAETGGAGTAGSGGSGLVELDCDAAMPSGGQARSGNGTGGEGNLAWEIWSNTGQGGLTTYDTPALIASWNNSGGYLGRIGFEWGGFGDTPVPHDQRGTITAQFASRKTGSAGGYSYVGMYGWTTNPCVEWYIVDDSYNNMPINPGMTTEEDRVDIDGGTYIMYTRPTTGTGGSRCSGATNWIQYYSVRTEARACGVISLTEHFNAWQGLGMDMTGELLEAKILVEVGGGVGNVELPIANVTVTPP
jgi:hypothetical protein